MTPNIIFKSLRRIWSVICWQSSLLEEYIQLCLVYLSTGCVTDHSVSAQSSKYEIPSLILATISRGVSVMLAVFTVLTTASTSRSTREIISAHSRQPASRRICSRYLQLINTSIFTLLFNSDRVTVIQLLFVSTLLCNLPEINWFTNFCCEMKMIWTVLYQAPQSPTFLKSILSLKS